MWTIDYEADIASDLSVFHRIDDPMSVPGPLYFSFAIRLAAYAGVIAARAEKLRQDREGGGSSRPSTTSAPSRVEDTTALSMLDGNWVEHVKEEEVV
jgi:hypothetical protein